MSKTILVVDDSAAVRTVVRTALCGAGYTVVEARDGADALGKLTGAAIDLIVSDVNMPNMDGIAFVRAVRRHPRYGRTPICILTTESERERVEEGRQAGAGAWLFKPFAPPKLLDAVSALTG
ncbi:MAG: response regulator [Ectothiorhodospiraceae bacterium]|nr:response regulator [Ectothiorhodospiraceae bacterium]